MAGYISILLIILLAGCVCVLPVTAHPPGNVALSYNSDAGSLNVTILHGVNGASDHFIREVTIEIQDKPIEKKEYSSQPGDEFTYSYLVTIPVGGTVKITAVCNKYGSLSKSLQNAAPGAGVPVGTGTAGSDIPTGESVKTATTPGLTAIGAVFALVCLLGLIFIRE